MVAVGERAHAPQHGHAARAAAGPVAGGGFWEVNTASHVDWPQQARIVELVNNGDGTLSVFGTIIDHAAPTHWPAHPTTPLELAALSRELGINDCAARRRDGDRRRQARRDWSIATSNCWCSAPVA